MTQVDSLIQHQGVPRTPMTIVTLANATIFGAEVLFNDVLEVSSFMPTEEKWTRGIAIKLRELHCLDCRLATTFPVFPSQLNQFSYWLAGTLTMGSTNRPPFSFILMENETTLGNYQELLSALYDTSVSLETTGTTGIVSLYPVSEESIDNGLTCFLSYFHQRKSGGVFWHHTATRFRWNVIDEPLEMHCISGDNPIEISSEDAIPPILSGIIPLSSLPHSRSGHFLATCMAHINGKFRLVLIFLDLSSTIAPCLRVDSAALDNVLSSLDSMFGPGRYGLISLYPCD